MRASLKHVILISATLLFSVSCAKFGITRKKSSDDDKDTKKVTEPKNLNREIREGDSVVWYGEDGFFIRATPHTVAAGGIVSFTSKCEGGSMQWDFKDGQSSTEFAPKHQFNTVGTYKVVGICSVSAKQPQQGSLTITVKPKANNSNPTQNPGQNTGVNPGQKPLN